MARIIYLMNASLDGFVEGPDGKFGWSQPDEEEHRFHNRLAGELGTFLYGRRMYETMAGWQDIDDESPYPDFAREFARIWRARPKIVFSRTLESVGPNCRLVRGDAGAEAAALKQQGGQDIGVSGPGLAASLAKLDLIDEYRLLLYPVMVGGGKSYFPSTDSPVALRLLETRTFPRGSVYLRYGRG